MLNVQKKVNIVFSSLNKNQALKQKVFLCVYGSFIESTFLIFTGTIFLFAYFSYLFSHEWQRKISIKYLIDDWVTDPFPPRSTFCQKKNPDISQRLFMYFNQYCVFTFNLFIYKSIVCACNIMLVIPCISMSQYLA